MENDSKPWTIETLKTAIEAHGSLLPGEFSCQISQGADSVLEVGVEAAGDVQLYVAIQEAQIITTTILWPRAAQDDPAAFEAMMLRSHKIHLPLCALSIDTINGEEYYELFGSMSAQSKLESVIAEFRAIATSVIDLAQDLGPRAQAN